MESLKQTIWLMASTFPGATGQHPSESLRSRHRLSKGRALLPGTEPASAEAIDAQGWLHTGDVGVLDERGYLHITDRLKEIFIVGAFNCYPAELERLLMEHEAIAQVAVIGIADARLGEVGKA